MKVVWILGAGFSRALGGPLLQNLFTIESGEVLAAKYGHHPRFGELELYFSAVRHVCMYGMGRLPLDAHQRVGPQLWTDPEEFVDRLDAAARDPAAAPAQVLEGHVRSALKLRAARNAQGHGLGVPPTVGRLRQVAKRLLALECAGFLRGADPTAEVWQPYDRWYDLLEAEDTVITFNYDRVLEMLNRRSRKLQFNLVGEPWPEGQQQTEVLKLHGSVDWRRLKNGGYELVDDEEFLLTCAESELAVATPGPTKSETTAGFGKLWEQAEKALTQARNVVFLGYRFPPTDAEARGRLLRALSGSRPAGKVHVVLGPDKSAAKVQRLLGLLHFAGRDRLRTQVAVVLRA
jgi:SIR2-like protein